MSLMDEFKKELRTQLVGKSIDCCSRWAEKRRIMGPPFPGPYSFKNFPWCRELHDSQAMWNVTLKSAQAGATEVGINLALYTIDVLRQNALYVLPTEGDARDFSTSRFNPALRNSSYLKGIFTNADNQGLKMAHNTALYIRGSNSKSGLKSIPVSTLFLDEFDEMNQEQVELAFQRLKGQPVKKIWMISTPMVPGHGVTPQYEMSTQEHFRFKCPGCGRRDELIFPDSIVMCGESITDPNIYKSHYKCNHCNYRYKSEMMEDGRCIQEDKLAALRTGIWEPTNPESDRNRRGFRINQLFSGTVSAAEITSEYMKAQTNTFALQEFTRSVLGEAFIEESSQVTDELYEKAIREYRCGDDPPRNDSRMITMGIDQGKTNYYVVCEWFYPRDAIDLNEQALCRILDAGVFLEDDLIQYAGRLMGQWQVRGCVIDADPGPAHARRFAHAFPGFVWLNRYREGRSGKQMTIDKEKPYAPLTTVDRTSWLDLSLGRFFRERIEIPMDLPAVFRDHIKNLCRVYEEDKHGNPFAIYKNFEKPDHFAHALNYAEMALPLTAASDAGCDVERFL